MTTYDDVNKAWGVPVALPAITAKEAAVYFKRLSQKFGGKTKNSAGRMRDNVRSPSWIGRRVWAAPKGTTSPLGNGWPRMVHDASHWVFAKLHPGFLTHSNAHAAIELKMIQHVIAKGWLKPKVAAKAKAKADPMDTTLAAIKRWTTKLRRAQTALRKLEAKRRRLSRAALKADIVFTNVVPEEHATHA